MNNSPRDFRPGDRVIDRDGQRGTVLRVHRHASRAWYDVKMKYGGAVFRRAHELRIDPAEVLFGWPRQIGGDE